MQLNPYASTDGAFSGPSDRGRSLEQLCLGQGLKLTEPRRLIVRILAESNERLSVEGLSRRAGDVDPGISIATVYRIVRVFEEKGILNWHRSGCTL